jgi:HAE1 family hydrophobic/amphiphilic exporter-1
VKKGQALFEIDPRTFEAAVDEAKGVRAQQFARYETARANLARVKPLAAKNAVSQKDLDDSTGTEQSAKAQLESADAALKTAKLNLGFTHITSPVTGIAGIAKAQIGDLLSPSMATELTTVSTVDPIKVYFNISEREYLKMASAAAIAIWQPKTEAVPLDADPGRRLVLSAARAEVALLNRQVDASTGTFKVGRTVWRTRDNLLRPGQYGRIRATMSVNKGALLVPQRAVTEMQGKYLIAVVGAEQQGRDPAGERSVSVSAATGSSLKGLQARRARWWPKERRRCRPGMTVDPKPFVPAAPAAHAAAIRAKARRQTRGASAGEPRDKAAMSKFFINRPIVAMVISILMTIIGLVAMSGLPIAQFPNIVPPEIKVNSTYTGADALTVEQAVATPIEQQMSGVDNMNYMFSINANNGQSTLTVNFDIATDANTDQLLAQMREGQAESQLPSDVRNYGVTVQKSTSSPLIMFALYSPNGTYDNIFLANYAYININDQMTRVKGIASVTIFGAGQYAMRMWVKPDQLAKLNITIPEIVNAVNNQNTVNPAGTIGAEPAPPGQEFTYAVRAQGRLQNEEEFGNVVLRANVDGSIVRVKDVARIELGAQTYNMQGRLNGKPAALVALYQMPGANALEAADGAKKLMAKIQQSFPPDLEYVVALDTTLSVTEGIKEIQHTLIEALVLVMIVVFAFLQGWRATLIPLLAVPVSLVGTFMLFPMFGFSINTLSLFGLVLAIGLVVDDAIVVVEAVEHHIEHGLSPKDATLRAMSEVTGPVIAIAVILAAVFVPTAFIPGITGQLYQQFAVTIAISVIISAFNALTLSPALCALLLRPKVRGNGPIQKFYDGFNRVFGRITGGYVGVCRMAIRKSAFSLLFLLGLAAVAGVFGKIVPAGFLPDEDQGYVYAGVQLPDGASLQRTAEIARQAEDLIMKVPGVKYTTTVIGYSMLSQVQNTYSAFFFITLEDWAARKKPEEQYAAIKAELNHKLAGISGAIGFSFPPPAIPGVGVSGGATFILEDRAGKDIAFLAENTSKFIEAAKKRPELAGLSTTFRPTVPQMFIDVDRDKVLKQGVNISDVYKTLQSFLGSGFINYFNRFGRQWQVYIQAEGEYRTNIENIGQFYVRNSKGEPVPLSALTSIRNIAGPEFTMRYNLYRSAQINASAAPGYSSAQVMRPWRKCSPKPCRMKWVTTTWGCRIRSSGRSRVCRRWSSSASRCSVSS